MIPGHVKDLVAATNAALARAMLATKNHKELEEEAWLVLEELAFEILNGKSDGTETDANKTEAAE